MLVSPFHPSSLPPHLSHWRTSHRRPPSRAPIAPSTSLFCTASLVDSVAVVDPVAIMADPAKPVAAIADVREDCTHVKAPRSRFKSAALKKIEKQVRQDAKFRTCANNQRGHGVASGAHHHGKPMVDSNVGHKRNSSSNEKSALSAMDGNKTNKRSKTNKSDNVAIHANRRDNSASLFVGQTPIKDSNPRQLNSSAMNVSSDPLLGNARKNDRRDDESLRALSMTNNKRSVPVQANRQVNHLSQPMKQDSPPRKNTNTKQVETIKPNFNITRRDDSVGILRSLENHDPLEAKMTMNRSKHINNSQSPQFKAMEGLVHTRANFNGLDAYNDALASKLKGQVSLDNGGGFIVDKPNDRELTSIAREEASPKQMKEKRIKEAGGGDTSDRNPMGEINGDVYTFGVKDYSERNLTYGSMKRQRGNTKTNEDKAIDNGDMKLMEVEDVGTQLETHDCGLKYKKKRGIESNEVGDGKADDSFASKNLESLPNVHVSLDSSNEAIPREKLTHRKLKKWRQDITSNEDNKLHVDGGDHSPLDADGGSLRSRTPQALISIDCLAQVPITCVLERVKQQCNHCSKPIDEPIWSGIFKIDGEEYVSLAGHLSTKSCEKVWEFSRSLVLVVRVTKLSRSKLKIWETSKPSCDSIGMYFFPNNKMRHDEDHDKLVKDVIEGDLVLQTSIGEAEMLIFPSTLLPERYKTFQGKHYLWGVFRPRQDQCATVAEPVHDTVCCAQEKEKEEQHVSNQQVEVQDVYWKSPARSMQQAAATRGVPESPNMGFQPEAPEERQMGDALRQTVHSAEAIAVATNPAAVTTKLAALANNVATGPAEATENDTDAATTPGNHGRNDSIVGVPSGRFFCFVAEQTPKLQQLIQEMQREGSLVLAIRGEVIGADLRPLGQVTSPSPPLRRA